MSNKMTFSSENICLFFVLRGIGMFASYDPIAIQAMQLEIWNSMYLDPESTKELTEPNQLACSPILHSARVFKN